MDLRVPPGSIWRVCRFVAPSEEKAREKNPRYSVRYDTVRASNLPREAHYLSEEVRLDFREVRFSADDILTVGGTIRSETNRSFEYVEVLLPRRAYINRTLFNAGLGYLERIA